MLFLKNSVSRLALATLALLPRVIGAKSIAVVVGGPGVLRYTPEYVVSLAFQTLLHIRSLIKFVECRRWG